ncbi:ThiF family adenylyltransferase [Microbulbifer sp. JMSA003]|uniref:ThiF family adenylyltransferase n=1 Tax=Microbulbifer sp. JMSA003 TaxID=3243369 RepID=UPI00403A1708
MSGEGLRGDAISLITRALLSRGLKLVKGADLVFSWSISLRDIEFNLEISCIDPNFLELPIVQLQGWPKELPSVLPHVIGSNGYLCYLDKTGIYFDPFEPVANANHIVDAVEQTLLLLVDGDKRKREYGAEFSTYWDGRYTGYLAASEGMSKAATFNVARLSGDTTQETLFYNAEDTLDRWSKNRSIVSQAFSSPAIVISLREPPHIPTGRDWPIATFREFQLWLQECHPSAEAHLIEKLANTLNQSLTTFIVLVCPVSGPFGVYVSFHSKIKEVSSRLAKKKFKRKSKFGLKHFRQVLRSNLYEKKFERIRVDDVTEDFLVDRNLQRSSIKGKKIALVGCGTVGSHLANLLVKIGAGAGNNGRLMLYDGDWLKPSNLGRHFLGVKYLEENKAIATADLLNSRSIYPVNIESQGELRPSQIARVFSHDLVVDATGDEQFSTVLAYEARRARKLGRKVAILHIWVDANGLAVRALLDDGTGGCYRCLRVYEAGGDFQLKERFELFKHSSEIPDYATINFRCGESYIPFSEGVSVIAAGVAQQLTSEYFSQDPSPRFRHIGLDSSVRSVKSQNVSQYSQCPCCSGSEC